MLASMWTCPCRGMNVAIGRQLLGASPLLPCGAQPRQQTALSSEPSPHPLVHKISFSASICVWSYDSCLFSLSVASCSPVRAAVSGSILLHLYSWIAFHGEHVASFLYPFAGWQTLAVSWLCKECCCCREYGRAESHLTDRVASSWCALCRRIVSSSSFLCRMLSPTV